MEIKKVTELGQIKKGDTILITGDIYKNEPFKALEIIERTKFTEVIIDKKKNKYFNVDMYLAGCSWVKEVNLIID